MASIFGQVKGEGKAMPERISLSINVPNAGSEAEFFSALHGNEEGEVETKQQEQRVCGDATASREREDEDEEETWELFEDAEEEEEEDGAGGEEGELKTGSIFSLPSESVEDAVAFSSPVRHVLAVEA